MTVSRFVILIAAAGALGACATEAPRHADVVTMNRTQADALGSTPPKGTVWRLDAGELQALSPAPIVEPPPPPNRPPPPRPNDPPLPSPGYYAPWWWGPSFHYWRHF